LETAEIDGLDLLLARLGATNPEEQHALAEMLAPLLSGMACASDDVAYISSPVATESLWLRLKLGAAKERARAATGRQGGALAHRCLWYPRDEVEPTTRRAKHYDRRAPRLLEGRPGFHDGGSKTNNERGAGCQGQGCRHQNAPSHTQPKKHTGRRAKWK